MIVVSILIFMVFPILGLPLFIFEYFLDMNKKKALIYSSLIGFTLGIIVFYFIPPNHYDLYRHQLIVLKLANHTFKEFWNLSSIIDLEILPLLYSYLISFTYNINFLQFFVVSIGYTLLLYILYDYNVFSKSNKLVQIAITLFTFFGFNAIYFISGLYCYIAIILFVLAVYHEYVKNGNKIFAYLIYIMVLFIHNSMFLPVGILFVYKLFGNKLSIKLIVICSVALIFAAYVLNYLNSIFSITILQKITNMYMHYVRRNDHMKKFYSGTILMIELIKWGITIFSIFIQKDKSKSKGINGYIILLSICTLILLFSSRVAIRYIMIIQLLGSISMVDVFKNKNKNNILFLYIIFVCSAVFILYFFHILRVENFGNLFKDRLYYNIFSLLGK